MKKLPEILIIFPVSQPQPPAGISLRRGSLAVIASSQPVLRLKNNNLLSGKMAVPHQIGGCRQPGQTSPYNIRDIERGIRTDD